MSLATYFSLLACAPLALGALTYRGVDWSSLLVEEAAGIEYTGLDGQVQPLETILAANGVNSVRQRLWVDPAGGDYGLEYNLELARRAEAAGLSVYLTLHFSDTWADPSHQDIPAAWPEGIDDLSWTLYNYTLDVANAFQEAGVPPVMISVGNEIRAGLLWPTGSTDSFDNVARLLNSASSGIRDSALDPQPSIMVHLDNGWDWDTQKWWYDGVLGAGAFAAESFDVMGVSFYPFYNSGASFAALETSLANMASTWGKDIVVAELDWPTSCPNPSEAFPGDMQSIPFSPEGQTEFIERVGAIVGGVGGGLGLYYWEPAWVDNQALGSSCESNTLFEWPGKALSSIAAFKNL